MCLTYLVNVKLDFVQSSQALLKLKIAEDSTTQGDYIMEAVEAGATSARSRPSPQWGPGKPVTSLPLHVRRVPAVVANDGKSKGKDVQDGNAGDTDKQEQGPIVLGISAHFSKYVFYWLWFCDMKLDSFKIHCFIGSQDLCRFVESNTGTSLISSDCPVHLILIST